ncbi:MAG: tRNA-dihydrouridine synthase family protein [Spirochaetia bacterium]
MATLTHPAFRTLVGEYGGCDLYFSEMISAEAFLGGTPFEYAYRDPRPDPQQLVYQLVGRSAEAIIEAARRLAEEPVHGIDVNMGCSAPQIAKRGAGVTWMQHPDAAARLIERIRAVAPGKTVSAKFRLGTGEDPDDLVDFARALEAAGASFLTLHPRFRRQSYSRPSRWSYVARLREALSIPLYGSGDISDAASVRARAEETCNLWRSRHSQVIHGH